MDKYVKKYAIVWLTLIVMYHVVIFFVPQPWLSGEKLNQNFWVGYGVVWLALAGQFLCVLAAGKYRKLEQIFLRIPLITTSYRALIVTIAAATICMFVPMIPVWVTIIVCVLALGFLVIFVVSAQTAGDVVSDTEQKIKENTYFIRQLTADAEGVVRKSKDDNTKKISKEVYEAVRYSNLMSNAQLSELETQIRLAFEEYSAAVEMNNEKTASLAKELVDLLEERNRKCKLMK